MGLAVIRTGIGAKGVSSTMIRRITCITFATLLTLSCSSDQADRSEGAGTPPAHSEATSDVTPAVQVLRGYAVHGHEVRSFRPCGSEDILWAVDPTGLLWNLHQELVPNREPYEEVFAVVEAREVPAPSSGFGADYPAAISIERVVYVGREGPKCDKDWSAFHYRVHGNEPFWSVEVSDSRIRLSRLGGADRLWEEITLDRAADGLRYTGNDAAAGPVELIVTRVPCRDSMSGSYYAFTAELHVGGEELKGCALLGTAPRVP